MRKIEHYYMQPRVSLFMSLFMSICHAPCSMLYAVCPMFRIRVHVVGNNCKSVPSVNDGNDDDEVKWPLPKELSFNF
ncbi:GH10388 [Drosophila grimshawi]|uniref:GH10388 n=1 Tax=Drosophila grimshawi TaxID=7222 RepID=B4JEC9_DROGR|nr:GH10388 [Drosophila grimshawi]